MNESLVTGQFINARRRLILLSVLSILVTGTLVGLATAFPLYNSVRAQIEQVNIANAVSQKDTIENQLERYHSLAAQFTSRTEIRKRLELFDKGEWTLEQLQVYSQPRLAEPASHIKDLAAMVRVSKNGDLIAGVGKDAEQIIQLDQQLAQVERLSFFNLHNANDTTLIKVVADIYSGEDELIGHDILYFDTSELGASFVNFGTYGTRADLFMVNRQLSEALTRDHAFNKLIRVKLTPLHAHTLAKMDNEQPRIYDFEENTQYALIHVPFDENWSLVIRIPQKEFYESATQDLAWALITIISMIVLGIILTRLAVSPLTKQLLKQAQKIDLHSVELKLAASVFEHSQEAIIITDTNMRIFRINSGFKEVLSLGEDHQAVGRLLQDYIDSKKTLDNPSLVNANFQQSTKGWKGEVWYYKHIDSDELRTSIPTSQSVTAVKGEDGQIIYFIHIFNDISRQKAAEQLMQTMAMTDSLTGLPNRSALMSNLSHSIQSCKETPCFLSILFIDLDKFKPINDTHGHKVGDEVLKQVAGRIKFQSKEIDMVGRLGGDEFLLIRMYSCEKEQAATDDSCIETTAQKIINHLTEPFFVDGLVLNIGASIGIASYPKDGVDADDIVSAADQAMYQAKQSGRNQFVSFQTDENPSS